MTRSSSDIAAPHLRALAALAAPVVLSRLGVMLMGLTDTIIVGHFSANELAYLALAWAPTMVVLTTAIGLLTSVQVLAAQRMGEGHEEQTGAVLRVGLQLAFYVGAFAATALFFLGPWLLHSFGLSKDLAEGASVPVQILALSLLPYLLSVAISFWLEAMGQARASMWFMWVANVVNVVLNLWLVPGQNILGVSGAHGTALATLGARIFLLACLAIYVLHWESARTRYGLFHKPRAGLLKAMLRIGLAAAGSLCVETTAFAGMNIVAGWLGAFEAAGWSIVLNVAAIIFMLPLGLSSATSVLVGRAYGARDVAAVRKSGVLGMAVTTVLLMGVCALMLVAAPWVAAAYTQDPALLRLVVPALMLSCLFFITDGLQVVAAYALRARGDVWWPTILHVINYALVMLPLGWFLALPMGGGVNGIVWAVVIASLMAATVLVGRFLWLSRDKAALAILR